MKNSESTKISKEVKEKYTKVSGKKESIAYYFIVPSHIFVITVL